MFISVSSGRLNLNFDVDVYIDSIRNKSISRMRTRLREYDFDNKINNGDKELISNFSRDECWQIGKFEPYYKILISFRTLAKQIPAPNSH